MKSEFCLGVFRCDVFRNVFLASGLFSAIASPSVNRPTAEISGAFSEKPGFWNFSVWLCGSIGQLCLLLGVAWCVCTPREVESWGCPCEGSGSLAHSQLWEVHAVVHRAGGWGSAALQGTVQLQEAEFPSRGSALLWKRFIIKLEGFLKQ